MWHRKGFILQKDEAMHRYRLSHNRLPNILFPKTVPIINLGVLLVKVGNGTFSVETTYFSYFIPIWAAIENAIFRQIFLALWF